MNEAHEIEVRALGHGGEGIGHEVAPDAARRTWFIPGTLPGERVLAVPVRHNGKRVHAELRQVLVASDLRRVAPCPIAGTCGGCTWQHVDPSAQARLKAEIALGQLRRVLSAVDAVHPSPSGAGYRRRARLHVRRDGNRVAIGFHRAASHEVVDVATCMVLDGPCNAALAQLRAHPELLPDQGEVWLVSDGTCALIGLAVHWQTDHERDAYRVLLGPGVVGVHLRGGRKSAVLGRAELLAEDADGVIALPLRPFGFAQAQEAQNAALVACVHRLARAAESDVLELFCGVGNFTRALVGDARFVWACDDDRDAIARLRRTAARFSWRCEAQHRSALAFLSRAVESQRRYDTVVLDPPKVGLGIEGARLLAQVAGQRVVYVSCDPATLARDLGELVEAGFVATACEVFDLMPMTPEVEVVVALERRGP